MVDKIVELENNKKYLLLEETELDNKKYYFGLRLDDKEEPTNNYLFFDESRDNDDLFLTPVNDKSIRSMLLTAFTINFLEVVYDKI